MLRHMLDIDFECLEFMSGAVLRNSSVTQPTAATAIDPNTPSFTGRLCSILGRLRLTRASCSTVRSCLARGSRAMPASVSWMPR